MKKKKKKKRKKGKKASPCTNKTVNDQSEDKNIRVLKKTTDTPPPFPTIPTPNKCTIYSFKQQKVSSVYILRSQSSNSSSEAQRTSYSSSVMKPSLPSMELISTSSSISPFSLTAKVL